MNWRKLAVVGGLVLIAVAVYRRRGRRDSVEVAIEGRDSGVQSTERDPRDLEAIEGIGSAYAERLSDAGVTDTSELLDADVEALAAETEIAEGRIRSWIERAGDGTAV